MTSVCSLDGQAREATGVGRGTDTVRPQSFRLALVISLIIGTYVHVKPSWAGCPHQLVPKALHPSILTFNYFQKYYYQFSSLLLVIIISSLFSSLTTGPAASNFLLLVVVLLPVNFQIH